MSRQKKSKESLRKIKCVRQYKIRYMVWRFVLSKVHFKKKKKKCHLEEFAGKLELKKRWVKNADFRF